MTAIDFFIDAYKDATSTQIIFEFLAFAFGIWSVWLARNVNIWLYPTGLIATVITTYLLYVAGYLGDMLLNGYFSIMSIYGWFNWSTLKSANGETPISRTTFREKIIGIVLFLITIFVVFAIYISLDYQIKIENYFDIIASGIFFTAMWYMAIKKIESWTLWIIGDIMVIPLYAYRGLGILALQYLIFTILAFFAYREWKKILNNNVQTLSR
jgi:nicotinamide mononucleotide transporter